MVKKCSKCSIVSPINSFRKDAKNKDGYCNQCNTCRDVTNKQWCMSNRDKIKANLLRYKRSEKGLKIKREGQRRRDKTKNTRAVTAWQKRNPDKVKAYVKVRRAVKAGKLIRQPCLKCGCEKVEAHHEDYNRPLDVMWLCRKCHAQLHRIYK